MNKTTSLPSTVTPLNVTLPHVLYRWFDVSLSDPNRRIILLYRTVILDAFYDLTKNCPKAKAWLFTPSADLAEVADYADLTVEQVQKIATAITSKTVLLPAWRIWRYTWADSQ